MALANFSNYRRRANDIVAVASVRSLLTSAEAFLADGSFAALTAADPLGTIISIEVNPDGTFRESDFIGLSFEEILPGYTRDDNLAFRLTISDGGEVNAQVSHCMGSIYNDTFIGAEITRTFGVTEDSAPGVITSLESNNAAFGLSPDGGDSP